MKILVIGDLHGKKPGIENKEFDVILGVGDFCDDKLKTLMFEEIKERQKNPEYRIHWYKKTGEENAKKLIQKSLSRGREVLEYLNSLNKPTFIVPGNWDYSIVGKSKWAYYRIDHFKKIMKGLENIENVHNKKRNLENHTIIGYGNNWEPEKPYNDRMKWYEKETVEWMKQNYKNQLEINEKLFKKAKNPVIYLTHNSPHNTPLDKINNPKSPEHGKHYGSLVVREMIEKYQPILQVGGHMHENYGTHKIGRTLCVNAGFRKLTEITIKSDKITGAKLNC